MRLGAGFSPAFAPGAEKYTAQGGICADPGRHFRLRLGVAGEVKLFRPVLGHLAAEELYASLELIDAVYAIFDADPAVKTLGREG